MKIIKQTDNKFDMATRTFFLLFYAIGLIVFVAVGLQYMTILAWVLGLVCSAFGATVYGLIAKSIIDLVRKDRKTAKPDVLIRLFYVLFFTIATVAFVSIGFQYGNVKTWILAFVGSYAGAFIYSSIAWLIITLVRKDDATGVDYEVHSDVG